MKLAVTSARITCLLFCGLLFWVGCSGETRRVRHRTTEAPAETVDHCLEIPLGLVSTNGNKLRNKKEGQREFALGLELAEKGEHQAALQAFARAVEADPEHGLAHLAKAESHLYTDNDPEKMRAHLARAIVLLETNPRAHLAFADFSADVGDGTTAARHWACALTFRPDFHEARIRLAQHELEQGKFRVAEDHLRKIEKEQRDLQANVLLGDVLEAQGRHLEAARQMEYAAKVAEKSAALYRKAAGLYDLAKAPSAAERVRTIADEIDPPPQKRDMRPLLKRKRRKKKKKKKRKKRRKKKSR